MGAVVSFRRAYAIDPDPRLLFNLARSMEKIDATAKRPPRPTGSLASSPSPPVPRCGSATPSTWPARPPLGGRAAPPALQTFELVAETSPTSVLLTGAPDGAEILVDGLRMGLAPLSAGLKIHPGLRTISVRAEGFVPWQQQLEVQPGGRQTLKLSLLAAPPKPKPAPEPTPTADPAVDDSLIVPWTAWSVAGLSAAALSFGGVHILIALDDADLARKESAKGVEGEAKFWAQVKDRAEERLLISNVSFGIGGDAVLATGVILWLANSD